MSQEDHRILVVDDDDDMRELLALLLGDAFEVTTAKGGQEAVDEALRTRYDAIVLDLMMPQLDGEGVMGRLQEAGCDTPVILVSALSEVHERARALGAFGGERKPVNVDRLRALLRQAIASQGEGGGPTGGSGSRRSDAPSEPSADAMPAFAAL